ncbi:MAG: ABC transporter ATP-binding protein [Desulfobulbaceae bacterium]
MGEVVVSLDNVSKFYKLYDSPRQRLKEALHPFGRKYHREFYALRDVSLELQRGEVLGIVGKNGSGKSTLLKLIAGVLVPSSGTISVRGNVNALLELGSGLNPQFTGLQNIYFMGRVQGIDEEEMEDKVREIVEFSELGEFIHQPLRNYSSGMKSRLAFSIATTIEPEILILDEVLSVGDAQFRRKCFARMEKLVEGKCTVLFVSHNEQSVKSICTQAVFLDEGRVVNHGEPDEIVNQYLEFLYSSDEQKKTGIDNGPGSRVASLEEDSAHLVHGGTNGPARHTKIHEAEIGGVWCVEKKSGKKTKVLIRGKEYLLKADVNLEKRFRNLSLSLAIKSEQGVVITGISPRRAGQVLMDSGGKERLVFEFLLDCLLNPATYFIDVELSGDVGGKNELLCFCIDVHSFVVTGSSEKDMSYGFVELLKPVVTSMEKHPTP